MVSSPANSPVTEIGRLRAEWRAFVLGSLIVLLVSVFTMAVLISYGLEAQLRKSGPFAHVTLQQSYAAFQAMMKVNPPVAMELVWLAGSVGLFVLNLRFSRTLGRPRAMDAASGATAARLTWMLVVLVNSMLYAYIVPELVMLAIFSRWVRGAMNAERSRSGQGQTL